MRGGSLPRAAASPLTSKDPISGRPHLRPLYVWAPVQERPGRAGARRVNTVLLSAGPIIGTGD